MSYSVRNIVIALILAVVAAGLVIMYTSNVKHNADQSIKTTTVVVSKGDIVAGTPLNTLVDGGAFTTRQVATKDVVPGAFTSISSLNTSLATATNITAGAQVTPAMFSDSKDTAIVNQIHGTMRAVQLAFNANRVLGGTLKAGDHVDIFGEMTIQSSRNNSTYSQQTVAGRVITNVEVLSTYDTGVASVPLTSASGANSASGTDDGSGGDAVILAIPQNLLPDLMLIRGGGEFWMALRPSHGAQDTGASIATPCTTFGVGLTAVQVKNSLPICVSGAKN
ncbi:MAG TPA: Flp pilus assembly protein CpaB [Gaiellales bacterium]|jgi:pilus assembly protein CpaB|nr:Flp pilus assembly protein CpaB [Gaiellales bacterium]